MEGLKGTFIELQGWGDFDMIYTDCVLYHEKKYDSNELVSEFCTGLGLNPTGTGLSYKDLRDINDLFKEFLISEKGFVKIKTHEIIFSD